MQKHACQQLLQLKAQMASLKSQLYSLQLEITSSSCALEDEESDAAGSTTCFVIVLCTASLQPAF